MLALAGVKRADKAKRLPLNDSTLAGSAREGTVMKYHGNPLNDPHVELKPLCAKLKGTAKATQGILRLIARGTAVREAGKGLCEGRMHPLTIQV